MATKVLDSWALIAFLEDEPAAEEVEKLCLSLAGEFSHVTFFAGKLVFRREQWHHSLLHNDLAFAVQKRLQRNGVPMILLPVQV